MPRCGLLLGLTLISLFLGPSLGDTYASSKQRFVPPMAGRVARTPPNTFNMTYSGNPPAAVTGAIDYVLNLYDSWLVLSSIAPIRVNFSWENLTVVAAGLLGSAGAYWANVGSSTSDEVLAVYTAQTNSYVSGSVFEINARFNLDFNWYFGTDGNPPSNQWDFATVFMHELTHGMGMTSRLSPVGPSGSPTGLNNQNSDLSSMTTYDIHLWRSSPSPATQLTTWQNTSIAANQANLLTATTSNSLFFRSTNGGDIPLHSPNPFETGSSITHLNATVYSNQYNSLMRSTLANGHTLKPAALVIPTPAPSTTPPPSTTPGPTTKPPPSTTPPLTTPFVTTPQPPTSGTPKPSSSPTPSPSSSSPSTSPSPSPSSAFPSSSSSASASPAPSSPGNSNPNVPAWAGTYILDSSNCNTAACCCPQGTAVVTQSDVLITITATVSGNCPTPGQATFTFNLAQLDDLSGSFLFNGLTYSASLTDIPASLSISSGSCVTSAQCTSGACVVGTRSASSSMRLPLAMLVFAIAALVLAL